jgi:hypothetical protein
MAGPSVTLRVKDQGGGPRIYARWRDGTGQAERPIGHGWLVRVGEAGAKPNGKTIGDWRERRGSVQDGALTVDAAHQRVPEIVAAYEAEQRAKARKATRTHLAGKSLLEVATLGSPGPSKDDPNGAHEAWKHATLKNNTPNTARRLAREIGEDRTAESVTAEELQELIANGLQPMRNGKVIEGRETSRKMRATYSAAARGIFGYAMSAAGSSRTRPPTSRPVACGRSAPATRSGGRST